MAKAFLVCDANLIDGACPDGHSSWVASTEVDPFAIPTPEHFAASFNGAVAVLFPVIVMTFFVAWAVRMILEAID